MIRTMLSLAAILASTGVASAQRLDSGPQTSRAGDMAIRQQANAEELQRSQAQIANIAATQQENAARVEAYQRSVNDAAAGIDKMNATEAAQNADWQARVRACQAGDKTQCAPVRN